MTEWRDTVGYQGYEVSSMGEVRNKLTGRILKGWIRPSGHRSVCLGGDRQVQVHHLVLTAFVSRVVIEDILAGRVRKRGVWWERVA